MLGPYDTLTDYNFLNWTEYYKILVSCLIHKERRYMSYYYNTKTEYTELKSP